jgi:uncharacterized protein involved in outer membrane biogenesis
MSRRSRNFWIGLVLFFGTCGVFAYVLSPFIKIDVYREALERGVSAALGRKVSLEGSLSLTLSLQPRVILEHVSVSNPPWTSQPHLFRADRLEIGLSLGSLFRRRLEVETIALEGAELLLEEGPEGLDNWTFRKDARPDMLSRALPSVLVTFSDTGEILVEDTRIVYHPYPGGEATKVSIHQGFVTAPDDQTRKILFEGVYRDALVNAELTGGPIRDLFDPTKAWPVEGVLSTTGASASIKGGIGGANSDQMFDLQVQVNGDRLSALNELLQVGLPDSAPFMIAAHVVKIADAIDLNNVRGQLGASDLGGQLRIRNGEGRQTITGQLNAQSLQIHDLTVLSNNNGSKQTTSLKQPEFVFPPSLPVDVDLDVTVEKFFLGETDLGSLSLTAGMHKGRVLLDPIQFESFGGTGDARLTIDLKTSQTQSTFQAKVRSLNYGSALRALGGGMNVEGSTDFDLIASGSGTMLPEFIKSLTLNLQTRRTTFGFSDSIPDARPPLVLRGGSLRVSKGGPVNIVAQGAYGERDFSLRLTTASPMNLATSGTTWPLSLTAQAAGAVLEAKGVLNTGRPDLAGVLAVSLKGRRLSELDPDLPPVGPYTLRAQVTKEGDRYEVSDLRSRVGNSDLSGILEVNIRKARPYLTGIFTAKQIDMTELSRPGDGAIPSEAIRTIDADFTMAIDQLRSEAMHVAGLAFTAGLRAGRLKVDSVQGTLLDRKSNYAHVQGGLTLDAAGAIPVLSGNVSFSHIRYDHIFRGVRFVNPSENVLTLNAGFSSSGSTLIDLLDKATVIIEGEKIPLKVYPGGDDSQPVEVMTDLKVESMDGGPLRFHADGTFQNMPFRVQSFTGPLGGLLKDKGLWPVDVALEVPHAQVELSGHLQLPLALASDEFTFQMLVKSEKLENLNFLKSSGFPDVGPVDLKVVLTRTPVGFHVTEIEGVLGANRWQGNMTVMTKRDRPRVRGKLTFENMVLGMLTPPPAETPVQKEKSTLGAIKDIGSSAMDTVKDTLGLKAKSGIILARIIPDFTFPVKALRAVDLFLDGEIKHLQKGEMDLGHATFQVTLEDGYLTLEPLTGNILGGDVDGKVILDGKKYVPTLEVDLNIQGLDYARVARTFGGADLVKGQSQSIRLMLKGRGDTLHEVLEQASGELNLVDGPLQLATKYIDLWAADLITTALSTAWTNEPVTNLNCMVGYFDIEEGILKSENILIDTSRLTIAGVGKLNLTDETLDMILTPRPKDPSLFTLAHTVRITGPIDDPDVSSDKFRIAESGGWGLLGLATPVGWVIAIPQIAGTTMGTMKQNPCVEALKSREHTAQTLDEIKGGLWGRIKGIFSNSNKSSDPSPDNQP